MAHLIGRIIDAALRHPVVVLAIIAVGCVLGWGAMLSLPLDAIPDLSDTQVIVYSHWDRSPDLVEDQVTYPIVTAMLGAPRVKAVRGFSDYGYSYVYVIFEDGTDPYWARSRTLEYLSTARAALPDGVKSDIGPDATALGWVFQYALIDRSGKMNLADLRSYQDWHLRYQLRSVPGVAEIAPIGGFSRQYQVNLDPALLAAHNISVRQVVDAVRGGNVEASGRLLDFGGTEYMVRGRGYARSLEDFARIPLTTDFAGSQVRIGDVGRVAWGPDLRRGVVDLDGRGEVVSGVVIMRNGANALSVIDGIKQRLKELEPGLPGGLEIVPIYDRSNLIRNGIATTKTTILEVALTVVLIIVVFLWHFPSAVVPIVTMPAAVLLAFIPCRLCGVNANIMSLAGVALAFSELVDASIVVVEQVHKRLENADWEARCARTTKMVIHAIKEISVPTFLALIVIAVSFLPVLLLPGREGRLFRPLAYTKTFTMLAAAGLAVTLTPVLRVLLTKPLSLRCKPNLVTKFLHGAVSGELQKEAYHPLSRLLNRAYEPVVRWTLAHKWLTIGMAVALIVATLPICFRLGTESIPPLDEGAILYMPSTLPGVSIAQAQKLLQVSDGILRGFPEVARVLGKAGRAESATDPAPLSMLETVVLLKPRAAWPRVATWYSDWAPGWLLPALRQLTPDTVSSETLVARMDAAVRLPGLRNSWTMPIRGRIDMLSTGLRSPLGLKITGPDTQQIQELGSRVELLLAGVKGTRSVVAERVREGYYLDIKWDREHLARRGISLDDAQRLVENGIGGDNVSTVVSGRERYGVNVRFFRDFRSDLESIRRLPVPTPNQGNVALGELASVAFVNGPAMLRDENGQLTGYVYVDVAERDVNSYMAAANSVLHDGLSMPVGYAMMWSGEYEETARTQDMLRVVVPVTVLLICLLLYWNTGSLVKMSIVLLALPFSAVGAIWFLYIAGYHMSAATWIGLIALLGIDAETGVFMLLYLEMAHADARNCGRLRDAGELHEAVVFGAAKRLRPKFMTFATTCLGLLPVMMGSGAGSDIMRRMAAPMVGGLFTSFLLELLVYPAVYALWKSASIGAIAVDAWTQSMPMAVGQSGD